MLKCSVSSIWMILEKRSVNVHDAVIQTYIDRVSSCLNREFIYRRMGKWNTDICDFCIRWFVIILMFYSIEQIFFVLNHYHLSYRIWRRCVQCRSISSRIFHSSHCLFRWEAVQRPQKVIVVIVCCQRSGQIWPWKNEWDTVHWWHKRSMTKKDSHDERNDIIVSRCPLFSMWYDG